MNQGFRKDDQGELSCKNQKKIERNWQMIGKNRKKEAGRY